MENNAKILCLCSANTPEYINRDLDHAIFSLYSEGKKVYDEVILLDPKQAYYKFERGNKNSVIYFNSRDITNISTLIVRNTGGVERATLLLITTLKSKGCDIMDPMSRFAGDSPSKLITTYNNFKKGIGIDSYFVFSRDNAIFLIKQFAEEQKFPIITKPIFGSGGGGIFLIENTNKAMEFINIFFRDRNYSNIPLLIQKYIHFVEEYRAIVTDGICLGITTKIQKNGAIAANAAQGAIFIEANVPEIENFVTEHVDNEGILGVDIGRDSEGRLHLIEANYSPVWRAFEVATGINVAKKIIDRAIERLSNKKLK